jgi:hypothetical protein
LAINADDAPAFDYNDIETRAMSGSIWSMRALLGVVALDLRNRRDSLDCIEAYS